MFLQYYIDGWPAQANKDSLYVHNDLVSYNMYS